MKTSSTVLASGGCGVRRGTKGKAFNVSGNLGVKLNLAGGKHLLIGSQKPSELAQAIKQMRHSN
jgi:hypothetical protein